MEIYIDQSGIADRIGVGYSVVTSLKKSNLLLQPDIWIGEPEQRHTGRAGYSQERTALFVRAYPDIAAGRVDPAVAYSWWRVPSPDVYMSVAQAAAYLQLARPTIAVYQRRNRFAKPDVTITSAPDNISQWDWKGWTRDTLHQWRSNRTG